MGKNKEQAKAVKSYSCSNPKQILENNIIFSLINIVTILNMKDYYYQDTKSGLAMVGIFLSKIQIIYHEIFGYSTRSQLNDIMSTLGFSQLECNNENNGSFSDGNLLHMIFDILPVDANQIYSFFQRKVNTFGAISLLKFKKAEILTQNVFELHVDDIGEKSLTSKYHNILVTNQSKSTIVMSKLPSIGRSGNEIMVKQTTKINLLQTFTFFTFQTLQMFYVRGRCVSSFVSRRYACYGNNGTQQLYEENLFGQYAYFLTAFRLLVVPALYLKHRGRKFGLDNQYSNRRIVSISSMSTTNVFFVIGRSKVFSSRIFDEALVISSMIIEQNHWSVENGLQIAYTLVFPNDCRMFLHVPIYRYGYIYRNDQKNNAIPALRFEEPTHAVSMPNDQNWSGVNISLTR